MVSRRLDSQLMIGRGERRYELLGVLSQGGMGTVHLGRHLGPLGFAKRVAIKSLRSDRSDDPQVRAMLVDEARLTAHLNHVNIASTLDVVLEGDGVYVVMEHIEGMSLAELLENAAEPLPVDVACAIAHDVLVGLDHAHDAKDEWGRALGIVHCDVSPQNVMVGTDGLTRVVDFGIARVAQATFSTTRRTRLHGKLPYMAPEQIQGTPVDRRTDVYAAGVLLWEMLVGERLFQGPTAAAVYSAVVAGDVERPGRRVRSVSAKLDAVVMKALAREPGDRFATARDMARRLAEVAPLASRARVAEALRVLRASGAVGAAPSSRAKANGTFLRCAAALVAVGALGVALGAASRLASTRVARARGHEPVAAAPAARADLPRWAATISFEGESTTASRIHASPRRPASRARRSTPRGW